MTTLANKKVTEKPAFLIDTKAELIAERDRMEANWNNSMRNRMQEMARIAIVKFGTPLSAL